MNYPKLIKSIRGQLLLTQTELAQDMGVSYATINRWENSHHEPIIADQRKIRDYCFKKELTNLWIEACKGNDYGK